MREETLKELGYLNYRGKKRLFPLLKLKIILSRNKIMRNIGIYPGTFDPITFGHIDVIKRALKIVNKLN